MDRPSIYQQIDAERMRQDVKWGGPRHDDGHEPWNWSGIIHRLQGDLFDAGIDDAAISYRARLVEIAAVAVAAIESHDRKNAAQ